MTSIKEMSNQERINHYEELEAEIDDNDNKVHELTERTRDLLQELEKLGEDIIWP